MSNNSDYKVHKVFIKEAEFEILILEIPVNEIEDKLAYLAREKGKISKNFYEDFIIATCIANINQLLFHLNQQGIGASIVLKIRDEVVSAILKFNPILDPLKLVLNNNYVVKIIKDTESNDKETRKLVDNKHWDLSYFEDEAVEDDLTAKPAVPTKDNRGKKGQNASDNPVDKDIKSLEYQVVQKWWKRIGQYVSIRQFNAEDAEVILKKRYFHNRTSFGTFVVSTCVEDFEELFSLLDNLGIPNRVAPPLLMHELYELCKSVNEFLTFENAQKLSDKEGEDGDEDDASESTARKKKSASNNMKQYMKTKPKKRFKDLPKEDLINLADNMKVFLIGQDKAVDSLAEAIQRASVGLKDPNKPIGSFLFAGKTGCGKTLASKVLADELIRDRNNLVNIDCSEYSADHEYSKLIGAPNGYVGFEAGGFLTNHMYKNPFSVVVFDEVEKASRKVHELLLQIMEEGRLTDGKGKTVSFKDSIIIMTSNVGVSEIAAVKKTIGFGDVAVLTEEKKEAALDSALKKKFKPEFLNRLDSIIHFNTLKRDDYMRIIDIELYKLNDNLRTNDTEYKHVELKFDKKIKNFIFKDGIDDDFGARPLKRSIEQKIATPLARRLLSEDVNRLATVHVSTKANDVMFSFENKNDDPPFYLTDGGEKATASVTKAKPLFDPDIEPTSGCSGGACGDGCDGSGKCHDDKEDE